MAKLIRATFSHPDEDERIELLGDLAEQYLKEIGRHRASDCQHPEKELREKTVSGGGIQCKHQCLVCGAPVGSALKKQSGLPPWDEAALSQYQDDRVAKRDSILRKYIRLHAENDARLTEKSRDWQAEYQAYRRTPEWQAKRARVLRRANGICEGCLDARATVVHHLTYANMGDELFFQLVALCQACHEKAHPEHHEPMFYDNDYVPCIQCRWGDEGISCGKFEIPAYEALEAGGVCGPDSSAFEGLK